MRVGVTVMDCSLVYTLSFPFWTVDIFEFLRRILEPFMCSVSAAMQKLSSRYMRIICKFCL
jgi:hypothetical protein